MNYFNMHSHFSIMEGLNSPRELCVKAKELGLDKLVLTDTNGLYGIPNFLKEARELGLEGIIGSEIRIDLISFIIIPKSRKGYEGLSCFLSVFHLNKMLSIHECLAELKKVDDLIIISYNRSFLKKLKSIKNISVDIYFEMSPGFFKHSDYLWAKSQNIKCIANNKVHYIEKDRDEIFRLISAIKNNTTICRVDIDHFHNKQCFMFTKEEFYDYFSLYPDAIKNNKKLLSGITSSWFFQGFISPGYNDLPERICDKILKSKCIEKIDKRYHKASNDILRRVRDRLEYEMNIIINKKFSSYFLNIEDISSQCNYTCGRGSSAASIVNYLLEVTHVDPIAENLLFDRFMNLDRVDPPDIDVDFPSDQRDDILDYIFDKFKGRAAMVSNHNYLRGRSATREVAKVFGVKEDEISCTLDTLHQIKPNTIWTKIITYAQQIEGVMRHLSVHCGGVVITPKPITHYGPIEMSKKGYPVLQWEKDQTEQAGLIKTDILGNKGLSVIRDVINKVNERSDKKLNYSQLEAQKDEKTRRLFIRGNTVGVIHFESPRCRTLLAAFKDAELLTLSIVCSIIRPAAMVQANEMLRRFHGGKFSYLHPELGKILHITKGIMVYQEDVMRVSKALADFTSQEGNELRKTLAKKSKNKKLNFYKEKFFVGCRKNGVKEDNINLLWADILSFSGYSFCKPHSDSYSLVAFKSAYLKAHYPAEFMAAILKNEGGFYVGNIEDYLNEARRMGALILPPDINLSALNYEGCNNEIRVGLNQLKNIKRKTLDKIMGERKKGAFESIEDFLERSSIPFKEAKILVRARCFGSVRGEGENKLKHSEIMWRIYQFYSKKNGLLPTNKYFPILSQELPELDKAKLIQWEYNSLNGFVTFPSWFLYKHLIQKNGIIAGNRISEFEKKEVVLFGQKVSEKRVSTKYKESMCFITFSDDTCMYNTTLFPKVYEECRDLIFLGGSFLIRGVVERDMSDFQLIVSEIKRIGEI